MFDSEISRTRGASFSAAVVGAALALGCQQAPTPAGAPGAAAGGASNNIGSPGATAGGTSPVGVNGAGASAATAAAAAAAGTAAVPGAAGTAANPTVGGAAGTSAGGAPSTEPCTGTDVVAPKRLVRLTFDQQVNAIAAQLDPTFAASLKSEYDVPDARHRTFPPLLNPREGAVVTESVWQVGDNIAKEAGSYVLDNFATVTGCGAGDQDCARSFLQSFAEQAYRRPLDAEEQASLQQAYDELVAAGSSAEEVAEFGVYAIYSSPQFLYRSEFGDASAVEGGISAYELASALSFFLTDAPPDPELLAAAGDGTLLTPDGAAAQVDRLLATPLATDNLEAAVFAYFTLAGLDTVVIDPTVAPEFNVGVGNAMYTEAEQFLKNTLWSGPVTNLLLSRQAFINQDLANLYGVAQFPPTGATLDQYGFAWTELPDTRSGLLTELGFLTSRARPDVGSVVARGLEVIEKFLCIDRPAVPADLSSEIADAKAMLEGASEREKADFRASNLVCAACHSTFDPYGLAIENYDIIGKYRTVDQENRPIDATVTLPDGTTLSSAVELSQHLATGGVFSACMVKNFFAFALAEGGPNLNSCAVQNVVDRFSTTDQSFASLIREIALSNTVAQRSAGVQ